jgi:L-rhamnose mutarotase
MAMDLKDDDALIAEYEAWHRPGGVPKEILENIAMYGFESMEIYRTGDRLFMVANVTDDFPRELSPEREAMEEEWQERMNAYQRFMPHAPGEKWVEMARIFDFQEHVQAAGLKAE